MISSRLGALVVSFAFGGMLPRRSAAQSPASDVGKPLDPTQVDSFFAVHADGSVTVYTGKVDVGTGLRIAIAQMAAEELGVPAARISIVDGDTGRCPDQGGTGGSTGLTRGGVEVRQAAATARRELLTLGAGQLNRSIAEQAAQCGYCTNGMIMAATALLSRTAKPTTDQVKDGLAGNLCRCGTHTRILRAVLRAALA